MSDADRKKPPIRLAVCASGGGTSLQNLLDRIEAGGLDARVVQVVASRPNIGAIARAEAAGVPVAVAAPTKGGSAAAYSDAVFDPIRASRADLVLFAIPEAADPAMAAVLLPLLLVDVAIGLERRDEFVTVPRGALRKLLRAGEVEPDALEIVRQRRHGTVSIV